MRFFVPVSQLQIKLLALLPNLCFKPMSKCTFYLLMASSRHTAWLADQLPVSAPRQEPQHFPFQLFVALSSCYSPWLSEICFLMETVAEITGNRVTHTVQPLIHFLLSTQHIRHPLHVGLMLLAPAGGSWGKWTWWAPSEMCWLSLRCTFPTWRSKVIRAQFRSWRWCNCINPALYPG